MANKLIHFFNPTGQNLHYNKLREKPVKPTAGQENK